MKIIFTRDWTPVDKHFATRNIIKSFQNYEQQPKAKQKVNTTSLGVFIVLILLTANTSWFATAAKQNQNREEEKHSKKLNHINVYIHLSEITLDRLKPTFCLVSLQTTAFAIQQRRDASSLRKNIIATSNLQASESRATQRTQLNNIIVATG